MLSTLRRVKEVLRESTRETCNLGNRPADGNLNWYERPAGRNCEHVSSMSIATLRRWEATSMRASWEHETDVRCVNEVPWNSSPRSKEN